MPAFMQAKAATENTANDWIAGVGVGPRSPTPAELLQERADDDYFANRPINRAIPEPATKNRLVVHGGGPGRPSDALPRANSEQSGERLAYRAAVICGKGARFA